MLPSDFELEEFLDDTGFSPFGDWFDGLDAVIASRIRVALSRLTRGAHSNVKSVGEGVSEYRIDTGPGYRLYLARHGIKLIILLGGGTKRRQDEDIKSAKQRWEAFKRRQKDS